MTTLPMTWPPTWYAWGPGGWMSVGDVFAPNWPNAPAVQWTVATVTPNPLTGNAIWDYDDPKEISWYPGYPGTGHYTFTLSGSGAPSGNLCWGNVIPGCPAGTVSLTGNFRSITKAIP